MIDEKLKRLEELCIERAKTTPSRGKEYYDLKEGISDFCNFLRKETKERDINFKKDVEYVFISGQMKSGTSLALSMLDNHKDIFCFPGDTRLIKTSNQKEKSLEFWINRFINPTGLHPFCLFKENPEIYYDIAYIVEKNKEENMINQFKILSEYFAKKFDKRIVVEKTPENEFDFEIIKESFSNFKMIYVYRSLIRNMLSQKRLSIKRNDAFNASLRVSYYLHSLKLSESLSEKENFFKIKYEDLTSLKIDKMCRFLKIDKDNSLFSSTTIGVPNQKNTMSNNLGNHGEIKISEKDIFENVISTFHQNELLVLGSEIQKNEDLIERSGYSCENEIKNIIRFNVMLEDETLDYVIKNNLSVSRMGDGELLEIIFFGNDIKHPVSKQKFSEKLREKMISVLKNKNNNLLLCIVPYFSKEQIKRASVRSQSSINIFQTMNQAWYEIMSQNLWLQKSVYGSTWFNRCNSKLEDSSLYFSKFKKLYKNKNVILVTGSNVKDIEKFEMFEQAKSITKVDIPQFDAFSEYDKIINECKSKSKQFKKEDVVFHISAGATGTILSSELTNEGYQSLDLGSIFNKLERVKNEK
tara:strand:+ start:3157 stop:4905 length:1749 start_codon:yes stop_codon:yes gene_type:complete